MEEGLFDFLVVDMAANTANGVNFSVKNPALVSAGSRMGGGEFPVLQVCNFLCKRLKL